MVDDNSAPVGGKLSPQAAGLLLDHLSAGISGQVPLEEVFRALSDDLSDRRLQFVAKRLAEQLEQGADIETATASLSTILPTHLRRALVMGVQSGNLSGILAGLSESELARRRMHRDLRAALAYPLLVLAFLTLVLVLMSLAVSPHIKQMYDDFQLELPAVTEFTFAISEALPRVVLILFFFILIVLIVSVFFADSRLLHWTRSSLPLLGRAWMWSGQHEFATLMATLTRYQVPIIEALACTSESLRDRNIAWATLQVSTKCEQGAPLSQSLQESIHFDPTLTSLTEWGETHHSLPQALREAADTYEQQMQLYTQFLYRIMPPFMLSIVCTTLFLIVSSMFMPLLEGINGLTG